MPAEGDMAAGEETPEAAVGAAIPDEEFSLDLGAQSKRGRRR